MHLRLSVTKRGCRLSASWNARNDRVQRSASPASSPFILRPRPHPKMYTPRPYGTRSAHGYPTNDPYMQRGRSPYGYPAGFQANSRFQEDFDDGTGAAPYLAQPSHSIGHHTPVGQPSIIQPLDGGLVDPTIAGAGATPYPSPAPRGRSLHRSISPRGHHRSTSRHQSPYHGTRSQSRGRQSRVYDDDYYGGVGYYEVGHTGDIVLEIDDHANVQVGNERVGFAPYGDYLASSGYQGRDGGRSYCRVPGETGVIFQDEYGNELQRLGRYGDDRRRYPSQKRRPIVIEDEYGEPLAYMGDDRDRYSDYSDEYYDDRRYDDDRYYERRGRSRSRIGEFFGVGRSRSRYGRDGPVIHVESAPGVDTRRYGHSSNVIYMDDDGRIRPSYVSRDGVHTPY